MTRLTTRLSVAITGLAACGVILTGCSSGQITQTSSQEAAVNGASANLKNIALRNVHMQAVQTSAALQPGLAVGLVFVAANDSPDTNDKLVGITSEVGDVKISGDGTIAAGEALVVNPPSGEAAPMGSATPVTAEVMLSKPVSNGLTYNFTFDFEKAGKATVAVPISAGDNPRE